MESKELGESPQRESEANGSDDYISLEALNELGIDRSELEQSGVPILEGNSGPCVSREDLEDRLPERRRPE
jgi:hypothetical protein